MSEEREIKALAVDHIEEYYEVGRGGVTRIEKTQKPGSSPYCGVPYIQVFKGENLIAEFCQHNIAGVYFKEGA